jgi:hypothetical protein
LEGRGKLGQDIRKSEAKERDNPDERLGPRPHGWMYLGSTSVQDKLKGLIEI